MDRRAGVVREAPTVNRETEPPAPDEQRGGFHERRRSVLKNPRVRLGLILAAAAIVVGGILLWIYFRSYESTDDAQIDGHLNPVSAGVSGHVLKLNVADNQYVQAGVVLVEIDPTDYQVAVERAKADYADTVAAAEAARVNVPITSVSTTGQVSAAQADVISTRAGITAASEQYRAAKAQLLQAQANDAKAQSDLRRYKQLVDKQEISQQQYDQAVAAAQSTAAAVQAASANVNAAEQQVIQARGKLDQAQANLRTAGTGATEPDVYTCGRPCGRRGEQPDGRSWRECASGAATAENCPARGRLGDGQFQRESAAPYASRPAGHHFSGCERERLQGTRGQHRRGQRSALQSAAAGECYRQLRESCATHPGENRF